jgi:hypothetical protein
MPACTTQKHQSEQAHTLCILTFPLSKSFTFIMAHLPSQQGSYAPVTAIPVSNDDPLAERFVGAVTAETVSTEAMPYLEVVAPASLPEVSCTCITLLV